MNEKKRFETVLLLTMALAAVVFVYGLVTGNKVALALGFLVLLVALLARGSGEEEEATHPAEGPGDDEESEVRPLGARSDPVAQNPQGEDLGAGPGEEEDYQGPEEGEAQGGCGQLCVEFGRNLPEADRGEAHGQGDEDRGHGRCGGDADEKGRGHKS